jgi:hypothetical protein
MRWLNTNLPNTFIMKNLELMECEMLTSLECQQVKGGSTVPKNSFWRDIAYVGTTAVLDFIAFVRQDR